MIKTITVDILTNEYGDLVTIIPSGFENTKIVVFEDPAYNIHAKYLTLELYEKLITEDARCESGREIKSEGR